MKWLSLLSILAQVLLMALSLWVGWQAIKLVRRKEWKKRIVGLLLTLLGVQLGWVSFCSGIIVTRDRASDICANMNMALFRDALEQWGIEHRKKSNDPVTVNDLKPYFSTDKFLVCPAGGTYSFSTVAELPDCSYHRQLKTKECKVMLPTGWGLVIRLHLGWWLTQKTVALKYRLNGGGGENFVWIMSWP